MALEKYVAEAMQREVELYKEMGFPVKELHEIVEPFLGALTTTEAIFLAGTEIGTAMYKSIVPELIDKTSIKQTTALRERVEVTNAGPFNIGTRVQILFKSHQAFWKEILAPMFKDEGIASLLLGIFQNFATIMLFCWMFQNERLNINRPDLTLYIAYGAFGAEFASPFIATIIQGAAQYGLKKMQFESQKTMMKVNILSKLGGPATAAFANWWAAEQEMQMQTMEANQKYLMLTVGMYATFSSLFQDALRQGPKYLFKNFVYFCKDQTTFLKDAQAQIQNKNSSFKQTLENFKGAAALSIAPLFLGALSRVGVEFGRISKGEKAPQIKLQVALSEAIPDSDTLWENMTTGWNNRSSELYQDNFNQKTLWFSALRDVKNNFIEKVESNLGNSKGVRELAGIFYDSKRAMSSFFEQHKSNIKVEGFAVPSTVIGVKQDNYIELGLNDQLRPDAKFNSIKEFAKFGVPTADYVMGSLETMVTETRLEELTPLQTFKNLSIMMGAAYAGIRSFYIVTTAYKGAKRNSPDEVVVLAKDSTRIVRVRKITAIKSAGVDYAFAFLFAGISQLSNNPYPLADHQIPTDPADFVSMLNGVVTVKIVAELMGLTALIGLLKMDLWYGFVGNKLKKQKIGARGQGVGPQEELSLGEDYGQIPSPSYSDIISMIIVGFFGILINFYPAMFSTGAHVSTGSFLDLCHSQDKRSSSSSGTGCPSQRLALPAEPSRR